jgi:hypothetical protein
MLCVWKKVRPLTMSSAMLPPLHSPSIVSLLLRHLQHEISGCETCLERGMLDVTYYALPVTRELDITTLGFLLADLGCLAPPKHLES